MIGLIWNLCVVIAAGWMARECWNAGLYARWACMVIAGSVSCVAGVMALCAVL